MKIVPLVYNEKRKWRMTKNVNEIQRNRSLKEMTVTKITKFESILGFFDSEHNYKTFIHHFTFLMIVPGGGNSNSGCFCVTCVLRELLTEKLVGQTGQKYLFGWCDKECWLNSCLLLNFFPHVEQANKDVECTRFR